MRIVGVIDLKGGRAVHAVGGRRDAYQPVARVGGERIDGDALALAHAYRDGLGLDELYVADLDAIAGHTPHRTLVGGLVSTGATVWLDAGIRSVDEAHAALSLGVRRLVVGLETLPDYEVLEAICTACGGSRVVLSLDLREGRLLCSPGSPIAGDPVARVAARAWRAGVEMLVVLDVSRVGGHTGPAFSEIRIVRDAVPEATVYAGGGIRSVTDLRELQRAGATGALAASALQDGRLVRRDLEAFCTPAFRDPLTR
jgi:phosphoribosylformimino-5-aminoimidazole carboxamide ribotide isomerase